MYVYTETSWKSKVNLKMALFSIIAFYFIYSGDSKILSREVGGGRGKSDMSIIFDKHQNVNI